MIRPIARNDRISRQRQSLPLRPFLQSRFGVDGDFRNEFTLFLPEPVNNAVRLFETAIDEHRAEKSLGGIGQNGRLVAAAAIGFAFRKNKMGTKSDSASDLGAGLASNEAIVAARKLPFAGLGILPVESLGDREPKNPVADEFEPLVIEPGNLPAANARVCQRALQERGILKFVSKFGLKFFKLARSQHGANATLRSPHESEEPVPTDVKWPSPRRIPAEGIRLVDFGREEDDLGTANKVLVRDEPDSAANPAVG